MITAWHLLIVDDDPLMVKTLADILTIKGYQVETAHSALLALEALGNEASGENEHRQCALDCVISDVKMPGMNGVELFRRIHARFPELPVILMTAYAEEDLLQHARQDGVVAVLPKPLKIPRLLGLLRNMHEQKETS
jgi:CheY-like chemotaxis protein